MESGSKKGFTKAASTFFSPLGFASPVAILDTVLFTDKPHEIGKPVSLMIRVLNSCNHLCVPKKRSIPLRSR